MHIYFAVLSAMLTYRLLEWVIIATAKTYRENKEKAEAFDKITKSKPVTV